MYDLWEPAYRQEFSGEALAPIEQAFRHSGRPWQSERTVGPSGGPTLFELTVWAAMLITFLNSVVGK